MDHVVIRPPTQCKLKQTKSGYLEGYEHEDFSMVHITDKDLILEEEHEKL